MDLVHLGQDAQAGRGRLVAGLLIALVALLALPVVSASAAGARPALETVRTTWTADLGVPRPTGMTLDRGTLVVAQGHAARRITLLEKRVAARAGRVVRSRARARVAVDGRHGVRYVLAADGRSVRRTTARGAVSRISLRALRGT